MFNVSNRQKASGVFFGAEKEPIFDAVIAAAIARFESEESHHEVIAEMEETYRESHAAWSSANVPALPFAVQ